jgi:ABC-type multidrug transport system fused ATPase/permease subunit
MKWFSKDLGKYIWVFIGFILFQLLIFFFSIILLVFPVNQKFSIILFLFTMDLVIFVVLVLFFFQHYRSEPAYREKMGFQKKFNKLNAEILQCNHTLETISKQRSTIKRT